MGTCERIQDTAESLLKLDPDPIPRVRILADLLERSDTDRSLIEAKRDVLQSRWLQVLAEEQRKNGSWGRFHSADSSATYRIPTTEVAVDRIVRWGLPRGHTIVVRTVSYLVDLLSSPERWPDAREKNDRWDVGQELFVAATLAELEPGHQLLDAMCAKWARIAAVAFSSGRYDPDAECDAHRRLTGAMSMRGTYLVIRNRYALQLLSCREGLLNDEIERALLGWLWTHPEGVGYLTVPVSRSFSQLRGTNGQRWLDSHRLLSRFESWSKRAAHLAEEVWALSDSYGFWDFGSQFDCIKLSENHRKPIHRTIDHTIYMLLLIDRLCSFSRLRRSGLPDLDDDCTVSASTLD